MIGYAMFGTNDVSKSAGFYDKILAPLDIIKVEIDNYYIGYANKASPREIIFYLTKPYNQKKASFGNGTMLAFKAKSNGVVDKCHSIALKNGAINEGPPGLREGYGNVYYSYFRDLDKNKICVYADDK
mgnify:FL=1